MTMKRICIVTASCTIGIGLILAPRAAEFQELVSADNFWYWQAFSGVKNIELHGLTQTKHGATRIIVQDARVFSNESRTQGYLLAVESFLSIYEFSESVDKRDEGRKEFRRLTGESFDSPEEAKSWLKANKPYLYYSEIKGRLAIDERAKREGIPTFKYREVQP